MWGNWKGFNFRYVCREGMGQKNYIIFMQMNTPFELFVHWVAK
jgi:hypothetical protein